MSTRRQTVERRQAYGPITGGLHVVLRSPGARIQLVVEGIVIRAREVRQHLELHVGHLRQGEVDLHLTGGAVRGRAQHLIGAVIRPLNRLAARSRRIIYDGQRREAALAGEAFQFHRQDRSRARGT